MKTFVFAAMLIVSLILLSCGGDDEPEPYPDITGLKADITELEADIDKKFEALQADIKGLQTSIAQGTPPPVIEGAVPVEIKDPVEEVQDRTGGLPPTGEPTGDPVDDPHAGVPVVAEGRIAFSTNGNDAIFIMGSNGAGVELVVDPEHGASHPSLSPDGQRVAYVGFDGNSALVIRHIESGAEFSIKHPQWFRFPAWSPDGKRIAYSDGSDIYIARADPINPEIVQVTHDSSHNETQSWSPDGKGSYVEPSWSPDGTKIAMNGSGDICIINVDGTGLTNITNGEGGTSPDWQ